MGEKESSEPVRSRPHVSGTGSREPARAWGIVGYVLHLRSHGPRVVLRLGRSTFKALLGSLGDFGSRHHLSLGVRTKGGTIYTTLLSLEEERCQVKQRHAQEHVMPEAVCSMCPLVCRLLLSVSSPLLYSLSLPLLEASRAEMGASHQAAALGNGFSWPAG